MQGYEQARTELRANSFRLSARDQQFADSLLSAARPSAKQVEWIYKLAERATAAAKPVPLAIVAVPRLAELMARAYQNGVKRARIRVTLPDDAGVIVIQLNGRTGRTFVVDAERRAFNKYQGRDLAVSYGEIKGAEFTPYKSVTPRMSETICAALVAFDNDPSGYARLQGHATGNCMFCAKYLKTAASVHAGYGPDCAKKYGLAWGTGDHAENLFKAVAPSDLTAVRTVDVYRVYVETLFGERGDVYTGPSYEDAAEHFANLPPHTDHALMYRNGDIIEGWGT